MLARRRRVDLVHCTGIYAPLVTDRPVVLTVHDLAIRHLPEAFPALNRRLGWHVWARLARRANHFIAISHATRGELIEQLGLAPEKVSVVHHGVGGPFRAVDAIEVERVRDAYSLPREYFIAVGTIEPRKNLARTLQAFRLMRGNGGDAHLAVVGAAGWGEDNLVQQLATGGFGPSVHYLGRIPDAHLAALYGGAVGLVYPSLYEGFGLPVLEAMACGCPVVTSARGGLPEAAGAAAVLVDPLSVDEIADALRALLMQPSQTRELARRGQQHAASFTWQRTAEETLAVYQQVLAGGADG
jgi:alpha-1,3-rhamnosyl/mannosyltransferase